MPTGRENTKAGETVYPIREGYIVKLSEPRRRYNWKLKRKTDHWLYVWIKRVFDRKPGDFRPQDRKVSVYIFYKPVAEADKWSYLSTEREVTFRYLTKMFQVGTEIITRKCHWHYVKATAKRFYRLVGMI